MPKTHANRSARSMRGATTHSADIDPHDPLQELVPIVDDDDEVEISDDDLDAVGDLGNEGDDAYGIDALIKELSRRPPSRLTMLMHRVAESIKALRGLTSDESLAWPKDRVPQEHWRALADEALGLIGDAARRELDEQRLIQAMPEGERESFQRLCDSRRGLAVFRKGFEAERDAWERGYWKRALDEAFGKAPWQGPAGWRSTQ